jgi:hypothetical protein
MVKEQQRLAKALDRKAKALPVGAPTNAQEARERAGQLALEQEKVAEAAGECLAAGCFRVAPPSKPTRLLLTIPSLAWDTSMYFARFA